MDEKEVLKIFKAEKAYLSGHFLLSSGLHSPNYVQCALLLQKPLIAETLCRALAGKLSGIKVDVVIGPALGGILVAYEMARALSAKGGSTFGGRPEAGPPPAEKVRAIFAERVEGKFTLRRGFDLKKNERALVVEDVITTGKSSREVIDLVGQIGAKTIAVASLVDRSGEEGGLSLFSQEFYALLKINIQTYKPEGCPLCRQAALPLTKPGSRGLST